jgi:hypothetical protein
MTTQISGQLENKVDDLSSQMGDMVSKMTKMEGQVKEMYTAIVGDSKFGQLGLVQRVEALEKTKKEWNAKVNWMYGYMAAIGMVGTLLVEYIKSKFR